MVITVTGHRPPKGGLTYNYKGPGVIWARTQLEFVLDFNKPELVYIGMALGWDTIVAITCHKRGIPYVAVIPFVGQEHKWPEDSQKIYTFLLKHAAYIHITNLDRDVTFNEWTKLESSTIKSTREAAELMDKRNKWQVDKLVGLDDFLLSFYDGSPGGTNNCVKYAKGMDKKIVNIEPL